MQLTPIKGRGSLSNQGSRFQAYSRQAWHVDLTAAPQIEDTAALPEFPLVAMRPATTVSSERARSIISSNHSPDIPFDRSVNAYRGCEHGCVYCYARPSHAYLDLSPGLDFETRLFAKENAPELLRKEFSRPAYQAQHIAMGTNTDPYQPIEKRLQITARLLDVFDQFNHPVTITTKSTLITRDIPVLARLARRNLVHVHLSIGTLNREVARRMEPRAATPAARIEAIRALREAGIPAGVIIAPVIPALTDHDLERVAIAASEAGAIDASYVLLRLPREVDALFQEWLQAHYPMKAAHVMNLVRSMRNRRNYDADFRQRMGGSGVHADMLRQRFERICARLGLNRRQVQLDTTSFRRPPAQSAASPSRLAQTPASAPPSAVAIQLGLF